MSISEQDAVAPLTPERNTTARADEWLSDTYRSAPGAACHALRVRLADGPSPAGPDALAERFAALAAELPAGRPGMAFRASARLWTERVPCPADAPAAERRRARELARPVDAPVRAVLLHYADGAADLVLVAHRAALGAEALRGFTARLLGAAPDPGAAAEAGRSATGRTADAARSAAAGAADDAARTGAGRVDDAARHAAELAECALGAQLDWGLGRPHGPDAPETRTLPLPADHPAGDAETWTAALGVVLARYEGVGRPVLATTVPDAHGSADRIALVPVTADGAHPLGTVDKELRTGLAAGPAHFTEDLRRELTATGADPSGAAAVGLVFADRDPAVAAGLPGDARDGEPGTGLSDGAHAEYRPFQLPPFPVTVTVTRDAAGHRALRCDFSPRTLSPGIADQFLRHVSRVHRTLVQAPDTLVADVRLWDEEETERLAALGRPGPVPSVERRRIDAAITAIAAERPDAVAVCFEDTRLTYGELDRRADRFAHALRALGVADRDRVGVCLERSAELIVALLAVLKAGATYVPMDPAYPGDRLAYTTSDAGLTTVITELADFPGGDTARVVSMAGLAELAPAECDGPPRSATGADDPAYVIYTSGSTGRPKGCVIPHVNVLSLMAATADDFALGADDTWTLFHSSAFDFSVWEIWGCLLTGGRLVVVPYWVSRAPEDFHALLLRERVSVLSQTPSAFAHLVEVERDGADAAPVRLVVFGGEGLDPRMLLPWFDRHPETACRVVNMYGITETTVHVTAQTVTRAEALAGSKSVGHALPGWWVRVADPEGRTLPVGVAGEIYVGGAGVASHYLNKPELTEQRFLTDPRTGERMYRSGDKGRLLPDGRLEHLGRLDSQVKLRGFRIELDEIRSVLLDDPQVTAAAVVLNRADPDDAATAQLDAYVVMDGDDTASVRQRATRFLPEYMVPSTVTALDRMPLTTNGKLDTRKLPKPAPAAVQGGQAKATEARTVSARATTAQGTEDRAAAAPDTAAPETAAPGAAFEDVLLEVWQEVLGVPVGPDDNFFDLGGNSLLAMRVGAALRRRGGPTVAMRDLYLRPTIRQLAADHAG